METHLKDRVQVWGGGWSEGIKLRRTLVLEFRWWGWIWSVSLWQCQIKGNKAPRDAPPFSMWFFITFQTSNSTVDLLFARHVAMCSINSQIFFLWSSFHSMHVEYGSIFKPIVLFSLLSKRVYDYLGMKIDFDKINWFYRIEFH